MKCIGKLQRWVKFLVKQKEERKKRMVRQEEEKKMQMVKDILESSIESAWGIVRNKRAVVI